MAFLVNWLVSALAIGITAYLLPGIELQGAFAALVTALILGLINAFVRPLLLILTLPLNVLTLGLLTFVINAFLILLTAAIVPGFLVAGFWWALLFSLVLGLVNWALSALS
jgi:putative membrane protein